MFAICCDTISSNTRAFSGAISVLTKALNILILWILCRHHICEVHISHFMEELTGEIQKAQGGVFISVCRRHCLPSSWQKKFVKIQQEKAPGWQDGSWSFGIPLPLNWCLLWSQVVQNPILHVVFHDLVCVLDLLTALEKSFTYNDLPLMRYLAESLNLLTQ